VYIADTRIAFSRREAHHFGVDCFALYERAYLTDFEFAIARPQHAHAFSIFGRAVE
jgi:hypothetical protein